MKRQIPRIRSQELLGLINVISCPHIEADARQKLIESLTDTAYPYRKEKLEPWWMDPPKGLQLVEG